MASWLVCLSPEWVVQVWALAGDIVLCSWARHLTLTVPFSTQLYKWVPENCWGKPNKLRGNDLWWTSILSRGSRNTPSRFMLQKPLWQLWSTRIERLHFFFIIIIIIIISITSKFRDIGGLAHFLLSLVAIRSISALIWDSFIPPILFILQHTEMTIFIWADAREGKKKITKTMRQILTSTPCKYSLRTVS